MAAKSGRSLLSGLAAAWAIYSRGCLFTQVHLTRLVGRAFSHGCRLASLAGSTLSQIASLGAVGFGVSAAWCWKTAKILARSIRDLAFRVAVIGGKALLGASRTLASAGKASLPRLQHGLMLAKRAQHSVLIAAGSVLAWIGSALASTAASARRLLYSALKRRGDKTSAGEPAENAGSGLASTALASPSTASPPQPLRKAAAPEVSARPAVGPSAPATTPKPAPAASQNVPGRTAAERLGLLAAFRPSGLAFGGLAAASIAFLILAFGPHPVPVPARAALTFPLPDRPEGQANLPERIASTEAGPETAAAAASVELTDPLSEMIAYVDRAGSAATADGKAFLAEAGAVEELDQFLQAAQTVGLERLLEPGEDYTFFIPNDAAFAELAPGEIDGLLEPAGHERLLTLLSHHILPERLTFDDLAGNVREYTSLAGQAVTIDATDVIRVGDAGMVDTDLPTENGILHVIDQVLPIAAP